jgi:MOSC domain-containing protein YiiM
LQHIENREAAQPKSFRNALFAGHENPRPCIAALVAHGRPGFYFRVLQEGEVKAGEEIVKVRAGPEGMSVAEINRLLYLPDHPRQNLERALPIPAPSSG